MLPANSTALDSIMATLLRANGFPSYGHWMSSVPLRRRRQSSDPSLHQTLTGTSLHTRDTITSTSCWATPWNWTYTHDSSHIHGVFHHPCGRSLKPDLVMQLTRKWLDPGGHTNPALSRSLMASIRLSTFFSVPLRTSSLTRPQVASE